MPTKVYFPDLNQILSRLFQHQNSKQQLVDAKIGIQEGSHRGTSTKCRKHQCRRAGRQKNVNGWKR